MLARREHARRELARKLSDRGEANEDLASVLDELEAENLLSDRRFAEQFVRWRGNRGNGPVRIRHELRERGVDPDIIASCLEAAEFDWAENAAHERIKKFGQEVPPDMKTRAKQMRFLQRRGYDTDQIKASFAQISAE